MVARSLRILDRIFPQGPLDLVRQVLLFGAAYYLYRISRGLIDNPQGSVVAFQNARDLISIEQTLGFFWEPQLHDYFRDMSFFNDAAAMLYMNAQTVVALSALLFIYFFHNERFYFVRNMFVVSMAIALIGYIVLPTAPPRFFHEYGFLDVVSDYVGVSHDDSVNVLFNPYAAVPSMHCCFAIFFGSTLARVCKHRISRLLWGAYPFVMVWCVVVTANHWIIDAVLGGATALLSASVAAWLARARPAAWAWQPGPGRIVT